MLKINKKFIMSKSELKEYDLLPDIPDNKLNKKQKEFVWHLYYEYIASNIDNYNSSTELCELPTFKRNWACGKRTTIQHRKMLVLNQLVFLNKHRKTIKNNKINDFLYSAIDSMEHYRTIVKFAYKKENSHTLNK